MSNLLEFLLLWLELLFTLILKLILNQKNRNKINLIFSVVKTIFFFGIKNKKQNPSTFVNHSNENAIVSNKDKSKNIQKTKEKNELNLSEKNNAVANNAKEKANQQ